MKKTYFLALIMFALFSFTKANAQDPYLGEIRMFAGNFAPTGWFKCDGQLLPISQYTALFAILGTTYGGDGITTFALPDFRGRVPINWGNGPGLTPRSLGEMSGQENTTLLVQNLPPHNHTLNASTAAGTSSNPTGNVLAETSALDKEYATTPNTVMNVQSVGSTGSGVPVNNMQPYNTVTFIIAYQGIFPSHP